MFGGPIARGLLIGSAPGVIHPARPQQPVGSPKAHIVRDVLALEVDATSVLPLALDDRIEGLPLRTSGEALIAHRMLFQDSPERDDRQWVGFKEWSAGSGQLKTEEFKVSTSVWRVSYKSTSGDRHGLINIVVTDADDAVVTRMYGRQADDHGVASGSFLVKAGPGTFALEIESHGLNWHVVAEQQVQAAPAR